MQLLSEQFLPQSLRGLIYSSELIKMAHPVIPQIIFIIVNSITSQISANKENFRNLYCNLDCFCRDCIECLSSLYQSLIIAILIIRLDDADILYLFGEPGISPRVVSDLEIASRSTNYLTTANARSISVAVYRCIGVPTLSSIRNRRLLARLPTFHQNLNDDLTSRHVESRRWMNSKPNTTLSSPADARLYFNIYCCTTRVSEQFRTGLVATFCVSRLEVRPVVHCNLITSSLILILLIFFARWRKSHFVQGEVTRNCLYFRDPKVGK